MIANPLHQRQQRSTIRLLHGIYLIDLFEIQDFIVLIHRLDFSSVCCGYVVFGFLAFESREGGETGFGEARVWGWGRVEWFAHATEEGGDCEVSVEGG